MSGAPNGARSLRIGTIGGGHVGGTLARALLAAGYEVRVGVPDPSQDKYKELSAVTPREAAAFGQVVILATPWSMTEAAIQSVAPELTGKILIDTTNPIAPDFSGLTVGHKQSGGQLVAGWASKARVVKAFNTIGANVMANPQLNGQPTTLLVAGDDTAAKDTVLLMAQDIGFAPLDVGGIDKSSLTEATAWLWITLASKLGREFCFNLNRVGA